MKRSLEDCANTDREITIFYDDDFDFFRVFIGDDLDDPEFEFTLSPIEAGGLARVLAASLESRDDSTRCEDFAEEDDDASEHP